MAVKINQNMTFDVMSEIKKKYNKKIFKKKVLLIGVSYKEDTNDTRHSPAEKVYDYFKKLNCKISFFDPIVKYWEYTNSFSINKKSINKYDVYVYLVKHQSLNKFNIEYKKGSLILDLNHVLDDNRKLKIFKNKNYKNYFIGFKS